MTHGSPLRATDWPQDESRYQHLAIESIVPGRIRLRIHRLHRNLALRHRLERDLSRLPEIRMVRVNELTGRVLLQTGPACAPEPLLDAVEENIERKGIPRERRWAVPTARIPEAAPEAPEPSRGSVVPATAEARDESPLGHHWSTREVLIRHGSSLRHGLRSDTVWQRLAAYGPNHLPEPARRSGWSILVDQVNSLPVALLTASAGISALTGGIADALIILGVIAVNAWVGYRTEAQAEEAIESLSSVTPPQAQVVRDGRRMAVAQQEVVPGDLLLLTPGTPVPADARLLRSSRLHADESALTGESLPVRKLAWPKLDPQTPLADRINCLYMGTTVTSGHGLAVATGTGLRTAIGEIQNLLGEARAPETPMQRQLDQLGRRLVLLSGAVCGAVFGMGLARGIGFIPMLKHAISLAVAAVPEGLTAVATTTLAMGIRRLSSHNVAIRRLDAIETLGAVQVICLDKTGTLTENRMVVVRVQCNGRRLEHDGGVYRSNGNLIEVQDDDELRRLWQVAVLCSDTEVAGDVDDLVGSPTENALVRAAMDAGVDPIEVRRRLPRIDTRYRSDDCPYMVTFHDAEQGRRLVAVKGSPSAMLDLCHWHYRHGQRVPLDEATRATILRSNDAMAGDALRVLGFAFAEEETRTGRLPELTWLGLVGMADPLRAETAALMAQFHRAGIRTTMITGDQSVTAHAIGRQVNISGPDAAIEILDASYLQQFTPEQLSASAGRAHVFARVSPTQKLQIVQALQQAGLVVAMTGDGINDSPALKAADIGIAMGRDGSTVARSVADIVIEDDNLHTMLIAVRDGRTIYDNVYKAIRYLVSTNISEIVVMLGGIGLGFGAPLNPMQLLWINLVTDVFPALALSLEPAAPDVLERPPRDPNTPIIQREDLRTMSREAALLSAAGLGSFAWGCLRHGPGAGAATVAFHTLASAQLLHAVSARSRHISVFRPEGRPANRYLNTALGTSLAAQVAVAFVPGLRNLLGLGRIGLADGLVIGTGAVAPLLINEALKPAAKPRKATRSGGQDVIR